MGIIKAFSGAISGTFADQWKDIVTAGVFTERIVVSPGVLQQSNRGRGTNFYGSDGVLSNGSKIFVPENTAAFVFSQSGIEEIVVEPGGYEYQSGQESVFNSDGVIGSIVKQTVDRVGYGGQTADQKRVAFVNLREIRDITFGTRGPLVYHDAFYGADLEIRSFGRFSIKVTDPVKFIKNYVPANVGFYSFDDQSARSQITSEFLQSYIVAVTSLSSKYRISELPAKSNDIESALLSDPTNAGTWAERFGFEIVEVGIENIEFTPESRELVNQFSSNKMSVRAYEDVSQKASNISAQQKIAGGVEEHGLGDGAGLIFGMNLAQGMNAQTGEAVSQLPSLTIDEQIEAVKKLKELVDIGALSDEEFEAKKSEIMGL